MVGYAMDILDLHPVFERDVANLSGGELQRFAIGVVLVQKVRSAHHTMRSACGPTPYISPLSHAWQADIYMFDDPLR